MWFIILFCTTLYISDHCIASQIGFKCTPNKEEYVYLVETPGEPLNEELNKKIIKKCGSFYDIETINGDSSIHSTFDIIKEKQLVINLWVSDYYNHIGKYNNIVYGGHVFEEIPLVNNTRATQIVKVVSKGVSHMNSGDLFHFLASLQYNNDTITSLNSCQNWPTKSADLKTVLICIDNLEKNSCFKSGPYNKNLRFKFVDINQCNDNLEIFRENLLAILAPKPFKTQSEVVIPVVFYDTPYITTEYETQFPNSINVISGLLIKHAFMLFITNAQWRRVAIISDESEYSVEFEKDILDMFHKDGIVYNVTRCQEQCDFKNALELLTRVDARIVIANVDEGNAKKLARLLPQDSTFTMLFRVLPFWDSNRKNWISITMTAKYIGTGIDCDNNPTDSVCNGVIQGLSVVAKTQLLTHRASTRLHRKKFYRKFSKTMKRFIYPESKAVVARAGNELISEMHITNDGAITHLKKSLPFKQPILDRQKCLAPVNNFLRPCDYNLYMYIMLVIIIFAMTGLTISYYFHESSPLNKKYERF